MFTNNNMNTFETEMAGSHARTQLPEITNIEPCIKSPNVLSDELITGILRMGHKLFISAASKAHKSFLLMYLCIAVSEGLDWLGFPCMQSRVLYINLEIDPNSCIDRFRKIYQSLGIQPQHLDDLDVWNLRGFARPLDQMTHEIIRHVAGRNYGMIVIDPLYKILTGDENSAAAMSTFCNQLDRICREVGCAVVVCHHHSKGSQGSKNIMDRASGSGALARDADALLDIIQLQTGDRYPGRTAWRMESVLREFPDIKPVDFWFDHPLPRLDTTGELAQFYPSGSMKANLDKSPKRTAEQDRKEMLDTAYKACEKKPPVKVTDLAAQMNCNEKTVRNYIKEFPDYWCQNGIVGLNPSRK